MTLHRSLVVRSGDQCTAVENPVPEASLGVHEVLVILRRLHRHLVLSVIDPFGMVRVSSEETLVHD